MAHKTFHMIEQESYREALEQTGGNITQAALLLGITRPQLDYRLRRLGLR